MPLCYAGYDSPIRVGFRSEMSQSNGALGTKHRPCRDFWGLFVLLTPGGGCVLCVFSWSCLTLCHPLDYRLSDSSIHGISQARILEWLAISFSIWSLGMHLNPRVRGWRVFCILGNYCHLHIVGPQRSRAGLSQGRYTLSSLGHFWDQNWWKSKDKIHMRSSRNGRLPYQNLWILCLGLVLL